MLTCFCCFFVSVKQTPLCYGNVNYWSHILHVRVSGGKCNVMAMHYFLIHFNNTCDSIGGKVVNNILSLVHS
jgi:hypothetical protein